MRFGRRQLNSQSLQGHKTMGQQAFAASFVDRRLRAIGNDHAQSALTRGDSDGEPGRAATCNENVSRVLQHRVKSPAKQQQLGTKSRTHRGEDAKRPRFRTPIAHDIFQHHQNRRRRKVPDFLEAIP